VSARKLSFNTAARVQEHAMPAIEAGTVDLEREATCVGCGCTDACGCQEGCTWLAVNRATATGVCSNCGEHLQDWKARQT
jgi:hypothetical protein